MKKCPAILFYPGDWLRSANLNMCSLAARGLWMHMICLMHDGEPYGYLRSGQKVISKDNLKVMAMDNPKVVEDALKELENAGVFSVDEDGCIYSRRMVKDNAAKQRAAEIREKRAKGGIKGGNPALLKKAKRKVNHKDNHDDNLGVNPIASASASASSPSFNPPLTPQGGNGDAGNPSPPNSFSLESDEDQTRGKGKAAKPKDGKARASSMEEVVAFVVGEGLPATDGEWFWNKMEGSGWKNGGKPVKDWKATIRSWKLSGYLPSRKAQTNGKPAQQSAQPWMDHRRAMMQPTEQDILNSIHGVIDMAIEYGGDDGTENADENEFRSVYAFLVEQKHPELIPKLENGMGFKMDMDTGEVRKIESNEGEKTR